MTVYSSNYQSSLGAITTAAKDDALIGLWFEGQKYYPNNKRNWTFLPGFPALLELEKWLEGYFSGECNAYSGKLAPAGSSFQKEIWRLLLKIPYGQTTTYGAIAKEFSTKNGQQVSAQAVGRAIGQNPISLVIPCHRVVGSTGNLTGYAGGLDKKEALLKLESASL